MVLLHIIYYITNLAFVCAPPDLITESLYALWGLVGEDASKASIMMGAEALNGALSLGGNRIENLPESTELCLEGIFENTLDHIPIAGMMNVYCDCGRIVWLDRSSMTLKLDMGKRLECMQCRNRRISEEIESMEKHFNGEEVISAE